MEYRRAKFLGGTYFFTVVTYGRKNIFANIENVTLIRKAFRHVMEKYPFTIDAFVLLPDHLHCIWTLPDGDMDFSNRWRLIKSFFTKKCLSEYRNIANESRVKKKEQAVWQRRFWEHLIRDDNDYEKHVEYIHYNPVKHGHVKSPKDWIYSSFHKYARQGKYDLNWGAGEPIKFDEAIGCE
jgi:putative transposase